MKIYFKQIFALFALIFSSSLYAASTDDSMLPASSACMIKIHTGGAVKYINVNYIRTISVSERNKNLVEISLASNYGASPSSFDIYYESAKTAEQAADTLAEKVTFCMQEQKMIKFKQMQKIK